MSLLPLTTQRPAELTALVRYLVVVMPDYYSGYMVAGWDYRGVFFQL